MKKQLPAFITGMLTAALIAGLSITALAATGQLTITVDPINVQVNGQVFAPKDVNGQDVPLFAYNGTTYAPLRALAEAYGLEVGYDPGTNMATVTGDVAAPGGATIPAPDTTAPVSDYSDWTAEEETAYQEFKGMWEDDDANGNDYHVVVFNGTLSQNEFIDYLSTAGELQIKRFQIRYANELYAKLGGDKSIFTVAFSQFGFCASASTLTQSTYDERNILNGLKHFQTP